MKLMIALLTNTGEVLFSEERDAELPYELDTELPTERGDTYLGFSYVPVVIESGIRVYRELDTPKLDGEDIA